MHVSGKKKFLFSLLGCFLLSTAEARTSQIIHIYGAEEGSRVRDGQYYNATYMLDLGRFNHKSNAVHYKERISKYTNAPVKIKKSSEAKTYSVWVGPFKSVEGLRTTSQRIASNKMLESKMGPLQRVAQVDPHNLSFLLSVGYAQFDGTSGGNGQTALGRLALGLDLYDIGSFKLSEGDNNRFAYSLGFEVGVENGKQLPVEMTPDQTAALGGLQLWGTVQPLVDFLATVRVSPTAKPDMFGIFKGGVALRRMQFDRATVENLYQGGGEIQAGLGFLVAKHASLSLLYQGVYGSIPKVYINTSTATASISDIPSQNGVLLTLAVSL